MGLSAANFGVLAGKLARAGVDIIKDDHGLSNQVFAPFRERVRLSAAAVAEANAATGRRSIYVPNVTAPVNEAIDRAFLAKELGSGAVMVSPGLGGFDVIRALAAAKIGVPIIAHPAFLGSYALNPQGIAAPALFGSIMRLSGADASIFPNFGGRFPLSRETCVGIADACRKDYCGCAPIFPTPAGGMSLDKVAGMKAAYGNDFLALVGGGLFSVGSDIKENCEKFLNALE
jgi:ribulose-bisphosphate carboxylase large chain